MTHLADAAACRSWLLDCGGRDDATDPSGAGGAAAPVLVVLATTQSGAETMPAVAEASTQLLEVLRCAAEARSVRLVLVTGGSQGPHLAPRAAEARIAGAGESSTEAGLWSLMRTARHELTAATAQTAGRRLWCIDVDDPRAAEARIAGAGESSTEAGLW
ncbi:MAG: hypothetical protein AAFU61_17550, partial [Pseudomonadota bacterium]